MTDLVERLRMEMRGEHHADLAREAANEIERLRLVNKILRDQIKDAANPPKLGKVEHEVKP